MNHLNSAAPPSLTNREAEVLARLAVGDSYKEMAEHFGITVQTVNDHTKNLYRKLRVHSRGAAAAPDLRIRGVF